MRVPAIEFLLLMEVSYSSKVWAQKDANHWYKNSGTIKHWFLWSVSHAEVQF